MKIGMMLFLVVFNVRLKGGMSHADPLGVARRGCAENGTCHLAPA